jgi:sulfur carrier protein
MIIRVNGKQEELKEPVSLQEFLLLKKIEPSHVVVELNRNIIPKDKFSDIKIKNNDVLEILRFVGGG